MFIKMRLDLFNQLLRIEIRFKLKVDRVGDLAAALHQLRLFEIGQGEINAWSDESAGGGFTWHFFKPADNAKFHRADFDGVAYLSAVLQEQGLFHQSVLAGAERLGGIRRNRFKLAVKWKITLDRANAGQARAIVLKKIDHGSETNLARLLPAKRIEQGFGCRREG